ncbi:MAG: hypothetical protein M1829_006449 [Trizodia sp. TS-e1964]|nr:MAG: hypothetical protein M1829_006449 [Trizodia sp. TS-e1964]
MNNSLPTTVRDNQPPLDIIPPAPGPPNNPSPVATPDTPNALEKDSKPPAAADSDESSRAVTDVLQSDIGVATLLDRLKQSIATARDFATFLKKRSTLEEEHAQGLKKLCRISLDSIRRPDIRQGTYSLQYAEITHIQERMADNGMQFALSLHQMQEDLIEMAANMERGRKHWKQTGLSAEKRVQDLEGLMNKAKMKYNSLAEDYDRAKTGDRAAGKVFGLKGPKSAAQHEEDLHRKVQAADSDYSSKVQQAHTQRMELLNSLRPQAITALQDLINESDSALTLQLQKFASYNEKLLLSNGMCISPLKSQSKPEVRSLSDVVSAIDNAQDLKAYLLAFASKVPPKTPDIKYERHPTLLPQQQAPLPPPPTSAAANSHRQQSQSISSQAGQPPFAMPPVSQLYPGQTSFAQPVNQLHDRGHPPQEMPAPHSYASNNFSSPQGPPTPQHYPSNNYATPTPTPHQPPQHYSPNTYKALNAPPQQYTPIAPSVAPQIPPQFPRTSPQMAPSPQQTIPTAYPTSLPPLKPVFGVSLDNLFKRDGSAVPLAVIQCVQAVDLFGLEVEGIYRLSGTSSHVASIKAMFDNDSSKVDFRNPENFYHDVNSVAGTLKQFFRELPDPLLTAEHYEGLTEAARIDDDVVRRDSLHAIINSLPDANYATLRALALHLHRIQENSHVNKMSAANLAIIFGPTLMGFSSNPNASDPSWQVRVVETILKNTYQIFDDD